MMHDFFEIKVYLFSNSPHILVIFSHMIVIFSINQPSSKLWFALGRMKNNSCT